MMVLDVDCPGGGWGGVRATTNVLCTSSCIRGALLLILHVVIYTSSISSCFGGGEETFFFHLIGLSIRHA